MTTIDLSNYSNHCLIGAEDSVFGEDDILSIGSDMASLSGVVMEDDDDDAALFSGLEIFSPPCIVGAALTRNPVTQDDMKTCSSPAKLPAIIPTFNMTSAMLLKSSSSSTSLLPSLLAVSANTLYANGSTTNTTLPSANISRMVSTVSADNISLITKHTGSSRSKRATPFDSLKDLVHKRKQVSNPTFSNSSNSFSTTIQPSTFLRKALFGADDDDVLPVPAAKRVCLSTTPEERLTQAVGPVLHVACSKGSTIDIQRLLTVFPGAAKKSGTAVTPNKPVYDKRTNSIQLRPVKERYTYPVNIAIANHVPATMIQMLIRAAPEVLMKPDGPAQECTLAILLKQQQRTVDVSVLDAILFHHPGSVKLVDRHFNTPLHVAVTAGASVDIIRRIHALRPMAASERNFNGLTPLDLARQQVNTCSHAVAEYLYLHARESLM